ncbi:MAG: hypothetical protein ACTSQI_02385, partial [Candidatus Helarchaeota archaeon]
YIQVKRNVSVSTIAFDHAGDPSNYVLTGEQLDISIGITDPLIVTFQEFDSANITFYYHSKSDPLTIGSTVRLLTKELNDYVYHLHTDGQGEPGEWPVTDAWMGMTGNISFTIDLYADSTFINGQYEYYSLSGWFHNIVDTKYDDIDLINADDPGKGSVQEQGSYLILNVSLTDETYGHSDAKTQLPGGSLINNRTMGTPIPDLYPPYPQPRDNIADTWNGTVQINWALIADNLSSWLGLSGNPNLEEYKWNGSLTQVDGEKNLYTAMIKIPFDAYISSTYGPYYINVTTTFRENEWGWLAENLSKTLSFTVEEAKGYETGMDLMPDTVQYYYWKNSSAGLTRFWIRYYNSTNNKGFNSSILSSVESYYVKSYALGYFSGLPSKIFGRSWEPIYWNHCAPGTLLPDGVTLDPHAEDPLDNNTWGWFYHDYNWTQITLPEGSFDDPPVDQEIQIGITADLVNTTQEYQKTSDSFVFYIKPNDIELSFPLQYQGATTFLDANYYNQLNMTLTDTYYWGDILNFTVSARDIVENNSQSNIQLRYRIKKDLSTFTITGWLNETGQSGRYSAVLNTSDPSTGLTAGNYHIWFEGLKKNYSINAEQSPLILSKRDTRLVPEKILGVYLYDSINDYDYLPDILAMDEPRPFLPYTTSYRTVPNHTIQINVSIYDNTPRFGGPVLTANMNWQLSLAGIEQTSGWVNTSIDGLFIITINLSTVTIDQVDLGRQFSLKITPYKDNFKNEPTQYPGPSWELQIHIDYRPIVLIPITPISMSYSQSNFKNHPIQFIAMDPISGENISGCTINWRIEGTDLDGTYMNEYKPGHYQVIFDTWPSLFNWIGGGIYRLSAEIVNTPEWYYKDSADGWKISELHGNNRIVLTVESEGFLGPLSVYFYIILGVVGAIVGGYYSYKSYKFLTTPYVIRKIEESITKISKDKKIAAGVMKSRDHLIFIEASDLLRIVGVALKPPPEKKLPPPIEKVLKVPEKLIEKIPEIPTEIIADELDKAGVRPEERPILLQQIEELGPQDKREFIESLIGEDRFKQLIEDLKSKETTGKSGKISSKK